MRLGGSAKAEKPAIWLRGIMPDNGYQAAGAPKRASP